MNFNLVIRDLPSLNLVATEKGYRLETIPYFIYNAFMYIHMQTCLIDRDASLFISPGVLEVHGISRSKLIRQAAPLHSA